MAGLRSMSRVSWIFGDDLLWILGGATVSFGVFGRSRGGDAQVIVGEGGEAVAYEDRLRGVATAVLRHPEKLTAATQHGILLPTSRPTTECQVRLNARRRRAMRMGSESATLHIRIDLTGISRRRRVSAAIPRTDTRLAQWSPYAAVWSRVSADMTGWARTRNGMWPC